MDIRDSLRKIRKDMGKTQKEVGVLLGIPQTTWASYEAGKATPPLKILIKLAKMGYCIDELAKNNSIIVGDNNMQATGNDNYISAASSNAIHDSNTYSELFDLIKNYATPKMLKEIKTKLLKIKEASDV